MKSKRRIKNPSDYLINIPNKSFYLQAAKAKTLLFSKDLYQLGMYRGLNSFSSKEIMSSGLNNSDMILKDDNNKKVFLNIKNEYQNKRFEIINSTLKNKPYVIPKPENFYQLDTLVVSKSSLDKNFLKKKNSYTSYSKLTEIKLLTIGIASPLRILQWSEKTLPNGKIYGEVLNANTLHHKTFKPQKGGLFCERIFGPLKDFECSCGKIDKTIKQLQTKTKLASSITSTIYVENNENQKKVLVDDTTTNSISNNSLNSSLIDQQNQENIFSINVEEFSKNQKGDLFSSGKSISTNLTSFKTTRKFCPDCDVEYTWSVIRRYQLGYIKLSSPVTHIWFLKGTPSYLSLLLDIKKRYLQFVTYCSEILTIEKSSLPFYTNFSGFDSDFTGVRTYAGDHGLLEQKEQSSIINQVSFQIQEDQPEKRNRFKMLFLNKAILGWSKQQEKRVKSFIQTSPEMKKRLNYTNENIKTINVLLNSYYTYILKTNALIYYNSSNKFLVNKELHTTDLLDNLKGVNIEGISKKSKLTEKSKKLNGTNEEKKVLLIKRIAIFKKILKKLPLDLYILCSLERMLCVAKKSTMMTSIKNTWKKIYRNAFFKAINKAKNILQLFYRVYITRDNLELLSNKNFTKTFFTKLLLYDDDINTSKTPFLSNLMQERGKKNIQFVLTTVKQKFIHHVLHLLENIKYPILSINYTSRFLKRNSFLVLEKLISTEIEKYLLKKTDLMQNLLTKSLLKSLILDQFSVFSNKKSTIVDVPVLLASQKFSQGKISGQRQQSKKEIALKTMNLLNLYNSYNLNQAAFAFGFLSEPHQRWVLKKKKGFENVKRFKPLKKYELGIMFNNSSLDVNWEIRKKKKIYNNIYTLSHRERWDIDKDWQIFSLFTFGITDFVDLPIPVYKNRLIALTTSANSAYPSYLLSLPSPLQNFSQGKSNGQRQQSTEPISLKVKEKLVIENLKGISNINTKRQLFSISNSFFSGAGIVQQLLEEFDFYEIKKLDKQNRLLLYQLNKSILRLKKQVQFFIYDKASQIELKKLCKKRDLIIRRTKLVRKIFRKQTNPSAMVLTILPVLPPDLRPIVKMGNQIAASDLNRLYQRVIYRNERLKKFLKDPATSQSYEMKYAQRLLQEAVDNLMQNGKSGPNSEKDGRGRALKSLSDILKGKQGRFRQFLLGKRVDYSGRSVIVVGPTLKLHECGLPVEMAKELYLPFLLKKILNKNYAKTVIGAKTLIQKNPSLANELLREIMQTSPILLNRAPTLHRLGIQAFIPKLIEGRAILLHPLVCSAFNADFDGDQMAVHLPITVEARAEAWKMMLSRNNILSPATGDPLAIPSQDMVLGCYYLTTFSNNSKHLNGTGMYFKNLSHILQVYEQRLIDIHAFVWVKCITPSSSLLQSPNPDPSSTSLSFAKAKAKVNTFLDRNLNKGMDHSSKVINQNKPVLGLDSIIENHGISWVENGNDQNSASQPLEIRISSFGQWQEITVNDQKIFDPNNVLISHYMCTTPGRVLFNLLLQKIIS